MDASPEVLERFLQRERVARKEAERLLEERSRQLYQSNIELKHAARAVNNEAQRAKAIFETAAEGIVIFDESGVIESFNPAAQSIFDIDTESAIGRNICELVPTASFCEGREDCAVTLRDISARNSEMMGKRADGSEVPVEVVISDFTHDGQRRFTAIVRDLSRRKALESQLAHAQKMESVGQLAAGIAHEINTPIQYVGDNTRFLKTSFEAFELILKQVDGLLSEVGDLLPAAVSLRETMKASDLEFLRSEIPAAIDQTLEGADNVTRIVRAMKEFSHPGSEELQEINLNHAIESTLTVCKNEWKYCAELVTEFADNLPPVNCQPGELNQALLNLVVNAAHAIQAKKANVFGILTVRTFRSGNQAIIEISDTGTGIPVAIRNRIFDPFFTTKGVGKGTGQGLAIAYNVIVEKHLGKLTFESVEGEGTTFRIELPINKKKSIAEAIASIHHD